MHQNTEKVTETVLCCLVCEYLCMCGRRVLRDCDYDCVFVTVKLDSAVDSGFG